MNDHNIAGRRKQDKLFCIATAMDSLVLRQCSIQRKPPHCRVTITPIPRGHSSQKTYLYLYILSFVHLNIAINWQGTPWSLYSETEEVISVFRSRMLQLHTTRSWDFMGLSLHSHMEQPSSQMHLKYGDDVIVGILDTGTCPLTISHPCKPCCTVLYLLVASLASHMTWSCSLKGTYSYKII